MFSRCGLLAEVLDEAMEHLAVARDKKGLSTVLHALAKQSANKSTELLRKGAISTGAAMPLTGSTSEALTGLLDIYKSASAAIIVWQPGSSSRRCSRSSSRSSMRRRSSPSSAASRPGSASLYIVDSPNDAVRKSNKLASTRLSLVGFVQEAYDIADNELSVDACEDLLLLLNKVLSSRLSARARAASTMTDAFIHRESPLARRAPPTTKIDRVSMPSTPLTNARSPSVLMMTARTVEATPAVMLRADFAFDAC